jgi:hypothetical protein
MNPNHRSGGLACIETIHRGEREYSLIPWVQGNETGEFINLRMDGIEKEYSSIPYSFGGK